MLITPQQRRAAIDQIPPQNYRLYSSPESGQLLRAIFSKYNLREELYKPYALMVGDIILGLKSETEISVFLKEQLFMDDESAQHATIDILNFLTPLHSPDETTPQTFITPKVPTSPLITDIVETETMLATAPTVRTMARDMHDLKSQADISVPSYASNQAATLGSVPPPQRAVPTPPPATPTRNTNPAARWGSETE